MDNIEKLSYSEFVGFTKERNRPSGGIRTVQTVAVNARIQGNHKMLEIGSNTGFTCVNMALLTGCQVVGVDINEKSIIEAKEYANIHQLDNGQVSFLQASALDLPFADESFDIVWCSNVTSFIDDKDKAIHEYLRVLKKGGTLVLVPIYYRKEPPIQVVEKVSEAIGNRIEVWDKAFWKTLFEGLSEELNMPIEQYFSKDYIYLNISKAMPAYVEFFLNKPHILRLSSDDRKRVADRLTHFMSLFNENLGYAGFTIFLFQKRIIKDELELFLTQEISEKTT